jgi:hypothetical protein
VTVDINDITAGVIILLGLVVVVLCTRLIVSCPPKERWINILCALAGLAIVITFILALADSIKGGSGLVPPDLGRPSVILVMGALAATVIIRFRKGSC